MPCLNGLFCGQSGRLPVFPPFVQLEWTWQDFFAEPTAFLELVRGQVELAVSFDMRH